jgi:hypothetical protein
LQPNQWASAKYDRERERERKTEAKSKEEMRKQKKNKANALDASRIADRDTKQNFKSDMVETMVVTAFHRNRQKDKRGTRVSSSLGTVQSVASTSARAFLPGV